jgi:enoyl-CoA hydratase/carnithine racemase
MKELVLYEVKNRVAQLTLNRPESLNALNVDLFSQLKRYLGEIADSGNAIGCVILKGKGKAFSAGHDLNDIGDGSEDEHGDFEASILEELAALPMPVVAQVHGYCFTGALELALACDLIFVDNKTKLADTHSQWGLTPIWGMTQRLPRRIGVSRSKDLMFSSRHVGAEEALSIGLVDRVSEVEELSNDVWAYAEKVVSNSRYSHRVCKDLLAKTDGLRLLEGLDYEYTNSPGACEDMNERIEKFTAKKNT